MEGKLDELRATLNNYRSQRWRNWRGNTGNGPLIVSNGGSAQIKDGMQLAEETWGGLWAVDAEELPKF
eukprot:2938867-Heterocapsa_arctica.AAC.1